MEFKTLTVGEKICEPSQDMMQFDIQDSGGILWAKYRKPTAKEIRNFKNGVPQFRYVVIDGVIYFLCRFGTGNWMEAPFHQEASFASKLPNPPEGQGMALHVLLVDASTGILRVQKIIGLSTHFTKELVQDILNQPIMSIQDYYAAVERAHAKYSVNMMVEMAAHAN